MRRRAEASTIDPGAFDRLLAFFDADREAAAIKYEDIRRRLVRLFQWRGCTAPEDCADRTIDRVARRLQDGVEIHSRDPYHYFQGVALNVLREHVREPERAGEQVEDVPAGPPADAAAEARLACLDECLGALAPGSRDLLLEYHRGDRHIERRQALAASLGIAPNALRIRVHRLRATVESCVTRCLGAPAETKPADTH